MLPPPLITTSRPPGCKHTRPTTLPLPPQMCDNVVRHRLTLGLRAERAWRRTKARLAAVALAPLRLAAELLKWLYVALRQADGWAGVLFDGQE